MRPLKFQTELSQSPAAAVASVYSVVAARSDLPVSQTVALQLLFDLNFVSQCMVAGGSTAIAQVSSEFGFSIKVLDFKGLRNCHI